MCSGAILCGRLGIAAPLCGVALDEKNARARRTPHKRQAFTILLIPKFGARAASRDA